MDDPTTVCIWAALIGLNELNEIYIFNVYFHIHFSENISIDLGAGACAHECSDVRGQKRASGPLNWTHGL